MARWKQAAGSVTEAHRKQARSYGTLRYTGTRACGSSPSPEPTVAVSGGKREQGANRHLRPWGRCASLMRFTKAELRYDGGRALVPAGASHWSRDSGDARTRLTIDAAGISKGRRPRDAQRHWPAGLAVPDPGPRRVPRLGGPPGRPQTQSVRGTCSGSMSPGDIDRPHSGTRGGGA